MIDRDLLDKAIARIRPAIQSDGGDIAVTGVDDEEGIVYVALLGACIGCSLSSLTLSNGVERVLLEDVPGVKHVLPDVELMAWQNELFSDKIAEPSSIKVIRVDDDGNVVEEDSVL